MSDWLDITLKDKGTLDALYYATQNQDFNLNFMANHPILFMLRKIALLHLSLCI